MLCTFNISREINWECLSDMLRGLLVILIDVRQHQPGQIPQVGTSYFQKHTWHMFRIQIFKRNRLRMVSDMSEASKTCCSAGVDNINQAESHKWVGKSYFKNTWHFFLYKSRKLIVNDLSYAKGLQFMFVDVDNVNQAESPWT